MAAVALLAGVPKFCCWGPRAAVASVLPGVPAVTHTGPACLVLAGSRGMKFFGSSAAPLSRCYTGGQCLSLVLLADGPLCPPQTLHSTGPISGGARRLRGTAPTEAASQTGLLRPLRCGSKEVTPFPHLPGKPQSPGQVTQQRGSHLNNGVATAFHRTWPSWKRGWRACVMSSLSSKMPGPRVLLWARTCSRNAGGGCQPEEEAAASAPGTATCFTSSTSCSSWSPARRSPWHTHCSSSPACCSRRLAAT